MAVTNIDAVRESADSPRRVLKLVLVPLSKYFERLGLDLLLFSIDSGYDVINDVERRHARISGAGQRLHRYNVNGFQADGAIDCRQRKQESDDRAVRVSYDE